MRGSTVKEPGFFTALFAHINVIELRALLQKSNPQAQAGDRQEYILYKQRCLCVPRNPF